MEIRWTEGQVWIETDFYEGPHDLLLTFAQRAQIRWEDLSVAELFTALLSILSEVPLEERIELLLFISHLLRLKAFALLPSVSVAASAEEPASGNSGSLNGTGKKVSLWERIGTQWEKLMAEARYRLPHPCSPSQEEVPQPIVGLSQMRLFRAYEDILRRYHRRHAVHRLAPLPFSAEEVESHLVQLFSETPYLSLSKLWLQLLPHPVYRAMAFLTILTWIQEGTLSLNWHSPWEVELAWQR